MSKGMRFMDEFKQDAVALVVKRGYAVSEVAERLGISTKSLYRLKAQYSKPAGVRDAELELVANLQWAPTTHWSVSSKSICLTVFGLRISPTYGRTEAGHIWLL